MTASLESRNWGALFAASIRLKRFYSSIDYLVEANLVAKVAETTVRD